MNFILYPQNFQLEQPVQFQTNDYSAKAKQMIDYIIQGFQNPNLQVGYALPDGSSGYLDPEFDLKQFYEANAQLFIVLNDQVAPQGAIQSVPISVYILDGDSQTGIAQEYADPNLQFEQYLIKLRQQYNLIFDSFILYDPNGTPLTNDQNQFIGNYGNYPNLNIVLINNQLPQPVQSNNMPQNDINYQGMIQQPVNSINPVQNQNDATNQYQQQFESYQMGQIKQQFGIQNTDQQLLTSQNYFNENNEKQQYDPQNQVILSQPNPMPMQQLQPQPQLQQIINPQVVIPIDQKIQQIKDSIVMLKNITLYFDPSGEFITYKYHQPILLSGSIRKSQSTQTKKFSNSKYTWSSVHEKRYEYAELDEYSFGIKWEGGNSSHLKIKQQ